MHLVHEDAGAFHLLHPSGMTLRVPKNSITEVTHQRIRGLPRLPKIPGVPHMADGGEAEAMHPAPEGFIDPATREYVDPTAQENLPTGQEGLPAEVHAPPPESALSQPDIFGVVREPGVSAVSATGQEPLQKGPAFSAGQPSPMPQLAGPPEPPGGAMPPMPGGPDYNSLERQVKAGIKLGSEGADLQARAAIQQAADMTTHYQDLISKADQIEKSRLSQTRDAQAQIGQLESDISNTKVDPSHFWNSKNTASKVSTGLGLILGGIGAGLTGGPNLAAQFLQRNIERDLEAQRADLGKKENLLGYMYKKYGNIQDASAASRAYLMTVIAGQTGLAAARSGNLQAQAVADMAKSQLLQGANNITASIIQGRANYEWQKYQMEWQRRIMSQGASPLSDPNYIRSGAHPPTLTEPSAKGIAEMHKDDNERKVPLPEIGPKAFTHAETPELAKELRRSLPEYLSMERNLDVIERLGKKHAWNINAPWPTEDQKAFNIATGATNLSLNSLFKQQRFTPEENSIYQPMMAKPRDFLMGTVGLANINALRAQIQNKRMADYEAMQLQVPPRPPERPVQ